MMALGSVKHGIVLLGLLLGCLLPEACGANDKDILLEMHNKRRAVVGSRPLTWDERLVTVCCHIVLFGCFVSRSCLPQILEDGMPA
jgi:hypothetical protein